VLLFIYPVFRLLLLLCLFPLGQHFCVIFRRAVGPGSKPVIKRHVRYAVVGCKIAVVQVVEVVVHRDTLVAGSGKAVESCMPQSGSDASVHQVEDGVDGVRWDDPVEEDTGEIEQVFDGVH